ncbi:MAG: aldo/keto reductase [Phenylobacterium sp.]|uniref:aldo/keto reductase n=1 Tax=Phenylobacterium sp. TaxID=1871053 RepID=UPI002735EA1D|nr:aldo/keto reductase [Phenylobacterium sp.]MDP3174393.1 aldo/keto reductase [Phenylobacterium sp.]
MELRRLGASGLKVSAVGLGCGAFGSRIDLERARSVVDAALDQGVNFFDTADAYGAGKSESFLGEALGGRRDSVVIATKFANSMGEGELNRGGSRRYIVSAVEASLKRLGTDRIDLYQMHQPDNDAPIEETLRALDDLVRAGKVLYIGNSNFKGWQISDADWIARNGGATRFVSAQNDYSILERGVEAEVLPACERFGLGFLPYFPLALGMLTGKYVRGQGAAEGTRFANPFWKARGQEMLVDETFDRVDALTAWAQERGHSVLELAFAWLLGKPVVSSVIAGATRVEQVQANAKGGAWVLTPSEVEEVAGIAA